MCIRDSLKLVLTIAYIVLLFAASNPLGLTLSILFLAVMYKVAKIPGKMILKSLKPILPIVIFTAVLNLFFVSGEGEPLVHIWFLTIYAEGVRYAVLMAVRVMALIAGTSLLTYTCLLYTSCSSRRSPCSRAAVPQWTLHAGCRMNSGRRSRRSWLHLLGAYSTCLYSIGSSAACQQSASRLKCENCETQRKR